ncbi:sulfotransferase family cytosolic 1B member 1 [Aplysia californica]|uniref:Sulfotransferase family cytosolic 1B member 1 n=1 Tax=Aplysia californica TaxID=6500 RepID=A0ABM1AA15_APLCA|nr:sulfotransferase family cytosolic 1B member 1 [Aplysia californica]
MRIKQYNYTGRNFASHLQRFVDGLIDNNSIFDYLREWERCINAHPDLNICILSYEDLQENTLAEVKRLSKFLGKDYDDEFLQAVIKATSFDNMKKEKKHSFTDDKGTIMFRKGKVGDWKNYFTVAQSEWFDHITRSRMLGSKLFNFRYDL